MKEDTEQKDKAQEGTPERLKVGGMFAYGAASVGMGWLLHRRTYLRL